MMAACGWRADLLRLAATICFDDERQLTLDNWLYWAPINIHGQLWIWLSQSADGH